MKNRTLALLAIGAALTSRGQAMTQVVAESIAADPEKPTGQQVVFGAAPKAKFERAQKRPQYEKKKSKSLERLLRK